MIIKVKSTDYIIGVWMVQQVYLGRVFVYSIKGEKENEWIKNIKYIYVNQNYNMHMHDNDYKNTFTYREISEVDMIKICNDKINELEILFCHNKEKILIGGDITKYRQVALKNQWLLPISETQEGKSKTK
jgi:hypothetical protein